MKKLVMIAAFAAAVSVTASFGTGRIEISTSPIPAHRNDQQWLQAQQDQQREQQQREQWQQEQQRKEKWQREQWQVEQRWRSHQHMRLQTYEVWLALHVYDYDNWRRRG